MRAASSVVTFGVRFAGATTFGLACVVFASACGSRGPLDDELFFDASAADVASADVVVPTEDAAPVDAGRDAPPSPIECGICLVGQCSQNIIGCVTDPGCREAFQCVITDCAGIGGGGGGGGGGGFDPACLLKCAAADPAGALQVLQIFQCVTGKCGDDCGPLLGGLLGGGLGGGGFPGGGGGSSGSSGGGKQYTPAQRQFAKAFSHWPELTGDIGSPAAERPTSSSLRDERRRGPIGD